MSLLLSILLSASSSEVDFNPPTDEVEIESVRVLGIPIYSPLKKPRIGSRFGLRTDPFVRSTRSHGGIDFPAAKGVPVYATADGIVLRSGRAGGYGNLVELNHGADITTRYAHLSEVTVEANSFVQRGDIIGKVGSTGRSTGNHLHYEIRIDGEAINPEPFLFLKTQYVSK